MLRLTILLIALSVALCDAHDAASSNTLDAFLRRSFDTDGNIKVGDESDFGRQFDQHRTRDIQAMADTYNSTYETIQRACD